MNISIYTTPEGVLEFTGSRTDGQVISGELDKTMTVEELFQTVEQTRTPEELAEEQRNKKDINLNMAVMELFEMVMTLMEQPPGEEIHEEEPVQEIPAEEIQLEEDPGVGGTTS